MPEPSALREVMLANGPDFPTWTSDQLADGITAGIRDREFRAVRSFLLLMALCDPDRAELILGVIEVARGA